MYWLREEVEVVFGIIRDYQIAQRIGITKQTLSKILNKRCGCSKAVANYITYLTETSKNRRYNDKNIEKYFYKKGE